MEFNAQTLVEGLTLLAFVLVGGFFVMFLMVVWALVYLSQIRDETKMTRSLIAAFMEHKVASAVAESRLATAVQQASKTP
jgi:hypothetical protein